MDRRKLLYILFSTGIVGAVAGANNRTPGRSDAPPEDVRWFHGLEDFFSDWGQEKPTFAQVEFSQVEHNNVNYNITKIPASSIKSGDYKFRVNQSDKPKSLDNLADGAVAAINGSFFMEDHTPIGYVKSEGKVLNKKKSRVRNSGFFVVDNGRADITRKLDLKVNYEVVLQSFPMMRYRGRNRTKLKDEPAFRSAVAVDKDHHVYFITTENGIFSNGEVNFQEFNSFLASQGYPDVLNLDGGASTSMRAPGFKQRGYDKIVNALCVYGA